jgi:hypothetical protein
METSQISAAQGHTHIRTALGFKAIPQEKFNLSSVAFVQIDRINDLSLPDHEKTPFDSPLSNNGVDGF